MKNGVLIFTDGASKGNPGPGGWGAVIALNGGIVELGGWEETTTNNRMELCAAFEALAFVSERKVKRIAVHTDSSYLINGITKWLEAWKKRKWMTLKKEEVLNQDIWRKLSDLIDANGLDIEWLYVGGHVGIPGNERADRIASDYADGREVKLYAGGQEAYGHDILNFKIDDAKAAKKSASRSRSHVAAYSYVSELNGEIRVHKTWTECEARVKGKPARFKKATSVEEEKKIIEEFSK
jgi:ribonuclease HI